jgi:hypothetical protein
MVVAVGFTVTLPLAFVAGRTRGLVWIALGVFALHVPLTWAAGEAAQLTGVALALALSTLLVLGALLWDLDSLGGTIRPLLSAAAVVACIGVAAFGVPALVLDSEPLASTAGVVLYVAVLALIRPRGLTVSWRYLRALG